eukprot:scaffold15283_cov56-Cyclotella_meneghiniana.AAC.1
MSTGQKFKWGRSLFMDMGCQPCASCQVPVLAKLPHFAYARPGRRRAYDTTGRRPPGLRPVTPCATKSSEERRHQSCHCHSRQS